MRDEIATAIVTGLPVLIAVGKELMPEWHAFAGPDFVQLDADPKRIEAWCRACMEPASSASEEMSW